MDSIKLWARDGEAVHQAIELGEIAHMETASEELTDEFLLFAIDSGLLKTWAAAFPDPRVVYPHPTDNSRVGGLDHRVGHLTYIPTKQRHNSECHARTGQRAAGKKDYRLQQSFSQVPVYTFGVDGQ